MSLPFETNSIVSLSCLHVLEHVGLGRYGDPLDPNGDRLAAAELSRVLAIGGTLLVVVPVGRPRVCFNAHRVYSAEMVRGLFESLTLTDWQLLPDSGDDGLVERPSDELVALQEYGCGCFRFEKTS
ncbi:MAG: DUF268 domain-containing protein [Lacipirellulaceae bacterium]